MTPIAKRERPAGGASARPDSGPAAAQQTMFVAVVHAVEGIRFVTTAGSRRDLVQRLADYTRRRGDHVLCSDHARHLRELLTRGELEAAVELYFGLVGERWDDEWLVTAAVTTDERGDIAAAPGEVALPHTVGDRPRLRDAS